MADFNLKNSRKIVKVRRPSLVPVFSNLSREYSVSPRGPTHQFQVPPNDWYEPFTADNSQWDAINIPTADFDNPTAERADSVSYVFDTQLVEQSCANFINGDDGGGGPQRGYTQTCGGVSASRSLVTTLPVGTDPAFTAIPNTSAVRVEATCTMGMASFAQAQPGHFSSIHIKGGNTVGAGTGGGPGYSLSLHGNYGGFYGPFSIDINLKLGNRRIYFTPPNAGLGLANPIPASRSIPLRLECYPVKNGLSEVDRDLVKAYWYGLNEEFVEGWNELGSYIVRNTDQGDWRPWGDPVQTKVGYYIRDSETNNFGGGARGTMGIGSFKASLATAVYTF